MFVGKLKSINQVVRACVFRDKIIFRDLKSHAEPNCVNLHWWKLNNGSQNVGDYLSTVVFQYMVDKYGLKNQTSKTHHLYAIGSIINFGYQDSTIWGSGFGFGKEKYWWSSWRKLDVRCVRGPKTRDILIKNGYDCPEKYGDPAVLLPIIYQPECYEKKYNYTIIRNHKFVLGEENELSPLTSDWKSFIDRIVQSKLIISSSLHGIILAESYGVPAIMLHDEIDDFKYRDYYASTGRDNFPIVKTVEEALNTIPPEIPNFDKMRKVLIETFPVDLWD